MKESTKKMIYDSPQADEIIFAANFILSNSTNAAIEPFDPAQDYEF